MAIVYGIDTDKKVTPEMIRDAFIICFRNALKEILESLSDPDNQMSPEEINEMTYSPT